MAQTDSNLLFVGGNGTAGPLTITSSAVGTDPLDLSTGLFNTGSTYVAAPLTIGNATVFAENLGVGNRRMEFQTIVGAAFVGGTSLTIAIQGAVDAASGSYPANLSGLTWTTYAQTGAVPVANLTAGIGIPMPDWPSSAPYPMPRFIRLLFTPAGTFSAGTIAFAGMWDQFYRNPVGLYPSGFSVGA